MTKEKIRKICKKNNIKDYIINDDMSIDVNNDVKLNYPRKNFRILPIIFNNVYGNFNVNSNKLTTLKGCPRYVDGYFSCENNRLTSLKYGPEYVSKGYFCNHNNITSLKYTPNKINAYFQFESNKVRTFDYFPNVKRNVVIHKNPIEELWNLFQNIDYIEHFNELDIIQENGKIVVLDRLNYFLTDIGKMEVNKNYVTKYIVK